ncbi:MAG: Spy/CpxP family protein refolding chaperone [Deltaproteobacteria bacterium]|nr:Spy/CpxP family protein refolding chaperone [Deltaproteobacteria bacterium]
MKKISVLAAVLLIVGVATMAMAGPRGMGRWGGEGSMELSMLDSVNLTPEQSEKILALKNNHFSDVQPLRSEMFNKRAELRLLWLQTTPDAAKIKATQDELWNFRKQLQDKRTDFRLAIRKILTPEQVTQILSKGCGGGPGSEYGKRHGKGFGRGRGRGPGQGN